MFKVCTFMHKKVNLIKESSLGEHKNNIAPRLCVNIASDFGTVHFARVHGEGR